MAWTYTYDTNTPLGTASPTQGDDRIRELKAAIQERLNDNNGTQDGGDHFWPTNGTEVDDDQAGFHRHITFAAAISTPALPPPSTGESMLYTKTVTDAELHFITDGGSEVQLTIDSGANTVLNITAAAIAKADTNIVDSDTITHTAGVLALKEETHATKGIRKGHLATDAKEFADGATIEIDGTNGLQVLVPTKGAGADAAFLPVCARGTYTGDSAEQTITVFAESAQKIRHLVIKEATNLVSGVEAIAYTGGTWAWNQIEGGTNGDVTLTDNTFVLTAGAVKVNKNTKTYYYIAYGEWAT